MQLRHSEPAFPPGELAHGHHGDGGAQQVGWFRFHFDEDRWDWSPEVEIITPAEHRAPEQVSAAIAEISENRAVIEQAKGMLMVVYGITAEAAFDLLRWRSQDGNVKLRQPAAHCGPPDQ